MEEKVERIMKNSCDQSCESSSDERCNTSICIQTGCNSVTRLCEGSITVTAPKVTLEVVVED